MRGVSARLTAAWVVALLLCGGAARAAEAAADDRQSYLAAGHVVAVEADGVVVVSRGTADGLVVGQDDLYFCPMRQATGQSSASVDFSIRLAYGQVLSAEAHAARVKLRAVTEAVEVGDYVAYAMRVPPALVTDSLFLVAALDVGLRALDATAPLFTLKELLADPGPGTRAAILQRLTAEVHQQAERAKDVLTRRIDGGRFHGKTLAEAFVATTPADLEAFVDFVAAYPGRYIGHTWKLVEVYATWLINHSPSGEPERLERQLAPDLEAARAAAARGELGEAEQRLRRILEAHPKHAEAAADLANMDRLDAATRKLASDPDDTAARHEAARSLLALGALARAEAELERLERAGYSPRACERLRVDLLVKQGRFGAAADVIEAARQVEPTAWSERVATTMRARATVEAAPESAQAQLATARVFEQTGSLDAALVRYQRAQRVASSSAELLEAAAGQQRIAARKELDERVRFAEDSIRKHDVATARKRVGIIELLADRVGDQALVDRALKRLAEAARDSWETELELELLRAWAARSPKDPERHAAVAWAAMHAGRMDESAAAVEAALKLDRDHGYSRLIRAYHEVAAGRWAKARKEATAAAKSKTYVWPRVLLARIAAAEGRWGEAVKRAEEAFALAPGNSEVRAVRHAALRGAEAARGKGARERLALVRALVDLELGRPALAQVDKLAGTELHDEASWAVAASGSAAIPAAIKLEAGRRAGTLSPWQARIVALREAEAARAARPDDGEARVTAARAYAEQGSWSRALAALGPRLGQDTPEVLAVAQAARDGQRADGLMADAAVASERGDARLSLKLYQQAGEVFQSIGYGGGAARAAFGQAWALASLGQPREGLALLEQALAEVRLDGDAALAWAGERQRARLASSLGTLDAMATALARIGAECAAADDEWCLMGVAQDLASLASSEGRLGEARREIERALGLARRQGLADAEREAMITQADILQRRGELVAAHEVATKLLALTRKVDDRWRERAALLLLGVVEMQRGEVDKARARFADVYRLGERMGVTWMRAQARYFDGLAALRGAHDAAGAAASLAQAAALYQSLGDAESEASAKFALGQAWSVAGRADEARRALGDALAMARKLGRRPLVGRVQAEVALVEVAAGQVAAGKAAADEAVAIAAAIESPEQQWAAWHALGRAEAAAGRKAEAIAAYDKALAVMDQAMRGAGGEVEQQGFLGYGRVREVYKEAVQLLLEAGQTNRALEVLELSRDANLRRIFDPAKIRTRDAALEQKLEAVAEAERQAAAASRALADELAKPEAQRNEARVGALSQLAAQTSGEVRQLLLKLKRDHRGLFEALSVNPSSLVSRRADLPDGAIVLEYFVTDDALFIFLIAPGEGEARAFRVAVTARELDETVIAYRRHMDSERYATIDRARKLYGWLLAPVKAELDKAKTVLVLPFGVLHYLPFHALVTSPEGAEPRYVLEDHRLAVVTSTTLDRLLMPKPEVAGRALLAFANPDGSLPGARKELERVTRGSFPDAKVLFEAAATEEQLRTLAGRYQIVHFATHGVLDPDPLRSHLKLANGPFTVSDIAGLTELEGVNDLVVLSACQTAMELGRSTGGEAISIAEAFAMAGAPRLVASLWDVDDEATSELMTEFYRRLKRGDGDTLEALRQAQLKVMRMERDGLLAFEEPQFWAAFALIGDYR